MLGLVELVPAGPHPLPGACDSTTTRVAVKVLPSTLTVPVARMKEPLVTLDLPGATPRPAKYRVLPVTLMVVADSSSPGWLASGLMAMLFPLMPVT